MSQSQRPGLPGMILAFVSNLGAVELTAKRLLIYKLQYAHEGVLCSIACIVDVKIFVDSLHFMPFFLHIDHLRSWPVV